MTAARIVHALLDSDEELLSDLANVAAGTVAHTMAALQSPKASEITLEASDTGQCDLEIRVSEASQYSKRRMISIRWIFHTSWASSPHFFPRGGGYFFLEAEKHALFEKALEKIVKIAKTPLSMDTLMREAWTEMLTLAYYKPRKRYQRKNYTTDGVYAYFTR